MSGYDSPAGWVRTVAYRLAVSSWRQARNRVTADRSVVLASSTVDFQPDTVDLVNALARLPAVVHQLVGLTVAEIGGSVSAVKQWLGRGRRALARRPPASMFPTTYPVGDPIVTGYPSDSLPSDTPGPTRVTATAGDPDRDRVMRWCSQSKRVGRSNRMTRDPRILRSRVILLDREAR